MSTATPQRLGRGPRPVLALATALAATLALPLALPATAFAAPSTPPAAAPPETVVALGDSGAAGPGSDRLFPDVATGGRFDHCRRSPDSAASTFARAIGQPLTNAACAGSTVDDLLSTQIDAVTARTRWVTVTTGSNDTGKFATLAQCARPEQRDRHCTRAARIAREHIEQVMPQRWAEVFTAIHVRSPQAHIIAIGYAPPFNDQPRYCGPAPFSRTDRRAVNGVIEATNATMAAAVRAAGGTYAGTDFTGHQICDRHPWLNGLITPTPGGLYHTNSAGQIELGWAAYRAAAPSSTLTHREFVDLARSDRGLDRVTLWAGAVFSNPSPFLWDLDWREVPPPAEVFVPAWRGWLRGLLGLVGF